MNRRLSRLLLTVAGATMLNVAVCGFADEVDSPTHTGAVILAPGNSSAEEADQPDGQAPLFQPPTTEDGGAVELSSASAAEVAPDKKPAAPPPKKPQVAAPPPTGNLYFNNNFSYLNDPASQDFFLGDSLKQLRPLPNSVLDLGGEYRLRDHHEFNMRNSGPGGSNLKGLSDDFLLQRERLYVNYRYADWFRFYGESINATESFNRDTPRNIEVNPWDALNLFAEVKVVDNDNGVAWARGGRQQLLYGAERLVSPLDWANSPRTFDGAKGYWKGKNWNVDAFWTRPVLFGQHILDSSGPTTGDITHFFDSPDSGQQFFGMYSTYNGLKNHVLEFYYLGYLEDKAPNIENSIYKNNFESNTLGTHVQGKRNDWLYEVEGGYQFGPYGTGFQSAGFLVLGGGYQLSERKWKPTFWTYYDWASGNRDPGSGTNGTFNQLFPLSHKYFGFMDLVGRQNIRDLNFQLSATPTKKMKLLAWYHIFELDQAKDSLYNAQGLAIRTDATGNSGRNVGQEIDLTMQYQFNARADVLFGYSHFFAGSFIRNTDPVGVSGNADFLYSQWTQHF